MLKSGEKRSNAAWQMTYGNEEKYIMIRGFSFGIILTPSNNDNYEGQ